MLLRLAQREVPALKTQLSQSKFFRARLVTIQTPTMLLCSAFHNDCLPFLTTHRNLLPTQHNISTLGVLRRQDRRYASQGTPKLSPPKPSSRKHSKVMISTRSLEEEYDYILRKLVQSHLPVINEYLDKAESFATSSQDSESAIDLLDSLTNDNYNVSNSIKRLGRLQNLHYQEVKAARSEFERYKTPVSDYHSFLKSLYPTDGPIRHRKLYEGYQALPTPRPLHISYQHLEDFISAFMDTRKPAHRAIYNTLIKDIVDCGMPVSVHEYNAATFMAVTSFYEDVRDNNSGSLLIEQIERLQNSIAQTNQRDSSTLNILYGFALKSGQEDIVSQTMHEFQTTNIRPDRLTMMIYLLNEGTKGDNNAVKRIYQEMCSNGYVIDISIINVLIKSMLLCGDFESAENTYLSVIQQEKPSVSSLLRSPLTYISPSSVFVKQAKLIDLTVRILKETGISVEPKSLQIPIVPDEFTFGAMLSHYSLKDGNFTKSLKVFQTMRTFGIQPGHRQFSKLYDGFTINSRVKASWNRNSLNQVTSMICHQYEDSMNSRNLNKIPLYSLFDKDLIRKIFKAYHTVFWDFPQQVTEIQQELIPGSTSSTQNTTNNNENLADRLPIPQTVYKALTKLMRIGHT